VAEATIRTGELTLVELGWETVTPAFAATANANTNMSVMIFSCTLNILLQWGSLAFDSGEGRGRNRQEQSGEGPKVEAVFGCPSHQ